MPYDITIPSIDTHWVDKLAEYIKDIDPDFLSRLKPATREQIGELKQYAGRDFPPVYQTFT